MEQARGAAPAQRPGEGLVYQSHETLSRHWRDRRREGCLAADRPAHHFIDEDAPAACEALLDGGYQGPSDQGRVA